MQYYGTQRGFAIEAGLTHYDPYSQMQSTLRTFPIVDFIAEDTFYVVQSRDLASPSFNSTSNVDALLDQLLEDGQDIQDRFVDALESDGSIQASELGESTTITLEQIRPITLQLVIRDGIASPSHWQQIREAENLLQERYGIQLEVVVIP